MNYQATTAVISIDDIGKIIGGTETTIKKPKRPNPKDVTYKDTINYTIKFDFGFN